MRRVRELREDPVEVERHDDEQHHVGPVHHHLVQPLVDRAVPGLLHRLLGRNSRVGRAEHLGDVGKRAWFGPQLHPGEELVGGGFVGG